MSYESTADTEIYTIDSDDDDFETPPKKPRQESNAAGNFHLIPFITELFNYKVLPADVSGFLEKHNGKENVLELVIRDIFDDKTSNVQTIKAFLEHFLDNSQIDCLDIYSFLSEYTDSDPQKFSKTVRDILLCHSKSFSNVEELNLMSNARCIQMLFPQKSLTEIYTRLERTLSNENQIADCLTDLINDKDLLEELDQSYVLEIEPVCKDDKPRNIIEKDDASSLQLEDNENVLSNASKLQEMFPNLSFSYICECLQNGSNSEKDVQDFIDDHLNLNHIPEPDLASTSTGNLHINQNNEVDLNIVENCSSAAPKCTVLEEACLSDSSISDDEGPDSKVIIRSAMKLHESYRDVEFIDIYTFLKERWDQPNPVKSFIDNQKIVNCAFTSNVDNNKHTSNKENDKLESQFNELLKMFPDCYPNYLQEKLTAYRHSNDCLELCVAELLASSYPKSIDVNKQCQREKLRNKYLNSEFNIVEYLDLFEDPESYFRNSPMISSASYKEHCSIFLSNSFRRLRSHIIQESLEANNHRLLATYRHLKNFRSKRKHCRKTDCELKDYPEEPCEEFYKEMLFIQNEHLIKRTIADRKRLREERISALRSSNALLTCLCCFDDECIPEETGTCGIDEHIVCSTCLSRYVESNISDCKTILKCLADECPNEYTMNLLQTCVKSSLLGKFANLVQHSEVAAANIEGLVSCPHCNFATILPPEQRVLKCLNHSCLRETCVSCNQPSHLPLRCNEVETDRESRFRAFIERAITEGMLRKCYNCGKNFVKIEGCNRMTCVCGAHMCYMCKKRISGYDHFNQSNDPMSTKCPLYCDENQLHNKEMKLVYKKAKMEYLMQYPEDEFLELKHDPWQHIKQ